MSFFVHFFKLTHPFGVHRRLIKYEDKNNRVDHALCADLDSLSAYMRME